MGGELQSRLAVLLGVCTESGEGPLASLGWQGTLPGREDTEGSREGTYVYVWGCSGGTEHVKMRREREKYREH